MQLRNKKVGFRPLVANATLLLNHRSAKSANVMQTTSNQALSPGPRPQRIRLSGHTVTVEPLDPATHSASLWLTIGGSGHNALWDYLAEGPFAVEQEFAEYLTRKAALADPLAFVLVENESGKAVGTASLMRIEAPDRVVEVGSIVYSPRLQRTRAATEAMYLLARYVFEELGYRRYEWKCNALNLASRQAAERLGFTFEGIFRQHKIVKGRNRDTAWFSMLDSEWPRQRTAFEAWLDDSNFDSNGRQKRSLREF